MNLEENINYTDTEPLLLEKNSRGMSKSQADPFYTVRDNVSSNVERIKLKRERFQHMIGTVNTATDSTFRELRKGIIKDLRVVEKDVKGLRGAIDMVEKNREKFPHIGDNELDSRKRFVEDSQRSANEVKSYIESLPVRQKIEADEKLSRSGGDVNNPLESNIRDANSRFIDDQQSQTTHMIRQQDDSLDQLGRSVDRLGTIGRDINTEIKEQNVLLGHLENDIDETAERMNVVQAALSKLLKTKDGCQIWTIVILGGILILLIALVIWT